VSLPVYRGPFGPAQAERLLWRAGFGPRRGEAKWLASIGLDKAVRSLVHPPAEKLTGPKPRDDKGHRLAPADAWGHDHLWWLDRMVRTNRPLVERMTLVWHDWFATSNAQVGSQRLMLVQNALFRRLSLGSFAELLVNVTRDPAMLLFLSGTQNTKDSPNENYGREVMELFTLGAGRGYTEKDVREQARALTGWQNDWRNGVGPTNFRFLADRHDNGMKTIFGKRGRFGWRDTCRLCLEHPSHASFVVLKLWSYFVPVPPDGATQAALEHLYRSGHYEIRPLVDAILRHPALYLGPSMVKPPVVYTAGLLRALGRGIDTTSWVWLNDMAGQRLFYPPNVAGWDDTRWLDTATFRGRWDVAGYALRPTQLDPGKAKAPYDATKLLTAALGFWHQPPLGKPTHQALHTFAHRALGDAAGTDWKKKAYPPMVENALRHLIAVSPELQAA
jgi:uncharacterized protein (DUF1800 family)